MVGENITWKRSIDVLCYPSAMNQDGSWRRIHFGDSLIAIRDLRRVISNSFIQEVLETSSHDQGSPSLRYLYSSMEIISSFLQLMSFHTFSTTLSHRIPVCPFVVFVHTNLWDGGGGYAGYCWTRLSSKIKEQTVPSARPGLCSNPCVCLPVTVDALLHPCAKCRTATTHRQASVSTTLCSLENVLSRIQPLAKGHQHA